MVRFVGRERISQDSFRDAIERAECGLIDANLGGGIIKQRIARQGQGRSGGYRTVIAYRRANRAVFLFGFAKSARDNISQNELIELRNIGSNWLNASEDIIAEALRQGKLEEVKL